MTAGTSTHRPHLRRFAAPWARAVARRHQRRPVYVGLRRGPSGHRRQADRHRRTALNSTFGVTAFNEGIPLGVVTLIPARADASKALAKRHGTGRHNGSMSGRVGLFLVCPHTAVPVRWPAMERA